MSAYPVVLDGAAISALVVGGGAVALRRTRALLAAGARVRVVAHVPCAPLLALAGTTPRLTVVARPYDSGDLEDATLVIAATDAPAVNARVAADARSAGRLVNVASAPALGSVVLPAVHQAGDLVIAVTAGGVPAAAARIRDALAARFDARYAQAIASLRAVRGRRLAAGERTRWRAAAATLLDERFCDRVEGGAFAAALAAEEGAPCR